MAISSVVEMAESPSDLTCCPVSELGVTPCTDVLNPVKPTSKVDTSAVSAQACKTDVKPGHAEAVRHGVREREAPSRSAPADASSRRGFCRRLRAQNAQHALHLSAGRRVAAGGAGPVGHEFHSDVGRRHVQHVCDTRSCCTDLPYQYLPFHTNKVDCNFP
eukprot:127616-Rhodomonas_salina.1